MSIPCDRCGKTFQTNTALYKHKHTAHQKPTLVLVDHKMAHRKRKASPDSNGEKRKKTKPDDGLTEDGNVSSQEAPKDDGQDVSDGGLVESDRDDRPSSPEPEVVGKIDFQKRYYECLDSHKRLLQKYRAMDQKWTEEFRSIEKTHEIECEKKLEELADKHKKKILEREEELEKQYGDMIKDLQGKLDDMDQKHKKELDDYEKKCQEKVKILKDRIKAMEEEGDAGGDTLSKAIFNCTSMEDIFKIIKLVNNHQMDEIVDKHLPTLQNLLLSLSMGILPICQPQRKQINADQRRIVEKVQTASKRIAKKYLRDNQKEFVNLFTVIKDSLKLARNTYNKYGI